MSGKSILQVPYTGTRVLDNTRPFLRSSIVSFWIAPAHSKERKYHIFRQYWYTRNVPVFTNTGTFQYLGPEVYFFRMSLSIFSAKNYWCIEYRSDDITKVCLFVCWLVDWWLVGWLVVCAFFFFFSFPRFGYHVSMEQDKKQTNKHPNQPTNKQTNKNIHSPNLIGIGSWGPGVLPHDTVTTPTEISVNWSCSKQSWTRLMNTHFKGANYVIMRTYLWPPWINSCQSWCWCVRVVHHVLLKYGHQKCWNEKKIKIKKKKDWWRYISVLYWCHWLWKLQSSFLKIIFNRVTVFW